LRLTENEKRRAAVWGEPVVFSFLAPFSATPRRQFSRTTKRGFSITIVERGSTDFVNQTLEPITESRPTTTSPPKIVAFA
jgi:hypothetical protein